MPPRCTPRSPPRAGPAACRPSSATSASSAPPTAAAGQAGTRRQAPAAAAPPKTRQVTRWLLTNPDHLDPASQAQLDAARAQCPHLDALAGHVRAFAKIMTRRQGLLELEDWLAGAEASDLPQLRSFAHGIRRDQQAVTAGLSLHWSSAAMEGNVNKIKMIKRQMYGRADCRSCANAPSTTLRNHITELAEEPLVMPL